MQQLNRAGVYVGPADLAVALGLPPVGDNDDPKHMQVVECKLIVCVPLETFGAVLTTNHRLQAVAHILAVCKKHGVPAGIHTGALFSSM
jgi:hypothetical protein